MIARHAVRKGQPRRSWIPIPEDLLKAPVSVPEWRPTPRRVAALLDQMDGDLFREVRKGRTLTETLEFLFPRKKAAKAAARGVRRLVDFGLLEVSVFVAATVPPVLYAVGV